MQQPVMVVVVVVMAVLLSSLASSNSQQSALVSPITSSITIPDQDNTLRTSAILSCGITEDTTAFTVTWTTPNGDTFTAVDGEDAMVSGRFTIQNAPVVARFPRGTTLIVMRLTSSDSGNYTCSVMINGGRSGEAIVQLNLQVTLLPVLQTLQSEVGVDSVTVGCTMLDYIHPDSDLQWRKGSQRILSDNTKYRITYNVGLPNLAQNGGADLTNGRTSSLTIMNVVESDEGEYTCFIVGTDQVANVQLNIAGQSIATSSTANTTDAPLSTRNNDNEAANSVQLPALLGGLLAAILGLIVVVLVIVVVVVAMRKRKKRASSTIILERDPSDDNAAYNSISNGGAIHGGGLPKYAKVDKSSTSVSPPPPLPARPSTNLSYAQSVDEYDRTPPGYEAPLNLNSSGTEKSTTINPYYDNPDDLKQQQQQQQPPPYPPRKKRTYYDEIEFGEDEPFAPGDGSGYGISTVPSPAAILSGSLQRNFANPVADNPSPDFSYPSYNDNLRENAEHDYDQIYSEPLDPTMLQHDYEIESNSDVPIPYSAIYEDPQPLHDSSPLRVLSSNIVEIKRLGTGQFGNVILARTVGLSMRDLKFSETDTDPNKSTLVAIKKLKMDADGCLMETFEKEVKFMARLSHDNVIRLLGICTVGESFIMMEYMENGDLNQFLQKQILMPDTITGLQENEVTPIILLYMGVQIASGMHYLGSHRFVHRDLATRNCLVGRDFIVKISDFGMSRSLYESAYYRVQGTLILPIRWMACETFYGKFSVKSDAWAFGVALWEIYTLGKVDPYDHMSDEEVIADAIRGPDRLILKKPPTCPQDVYEIMLRCWVHEPSMRADFGEIYSRLFMIYTRQAL